MLTANRIELQGIAQTGAEDLATSNNKQFTRFYLAIPAKKQDGSSFSQYYEIQGWNDTIRKAMHDGVYKDAEVRIEGYLSSRKNEKNGNVYLNYSIMATRIVVDQPKPAAEPSQNQYNQAAQQAARQVSADDLSGGQGKPASWINDSDMPW